MVKNYVLDTSVLLHSANSLNSFGENNLIIPYVVLEELDKFKTSEGEIGRNARQVVRVLNELRGENKLNNGVELPNGGSLRVELNFSEPENKKLDIKINDDRILNVCLGLQAQHSDVILITKDINLAVRADVFGVRAEDFDTDKPVDDISNIYTGTKELVVDSYLIDNLHQLGEISVEEINEELYPNQYLTLVGNASDNHKTIARVLSSGQICRVSPKISNKQIWGITPRNREQVFAVDALMSKRCSLVSLIGPAGVGKTLLALACALDMVQDRGMYDRLVVSRPVQPLGKDLGYLPGPQPLDAGVLTPEGWTTMGELSAGSKVLSRDGKPTTVLGVYPKGKKSVYRITTTDGTSTECCADHLWLTQTAEERKRGKKGSVRTTKEITETLESTLPGKKLNSGKPRYGAVRPNHFIPRNEPVRFTKKHLPLPPYILGCILGGGSIGDSVSIANTDLELIDRVKKEMQAYNIDCILVHQENSINYRFSGKHRNNKPAKSVQVTDMLTGEFIVYDTIGEASEELGIHKATLNYRCVNEITAYNKKYRFLPCPNRWQNSVKNTLYNLGLNDTKSDTKFIPEKYKYSSFEDRLALLQGLLDTDGTIKKGSGEISFCTTSKKLADGVAELVRSFGGRAKVRSRNRIGKKNIHNGRVFTTRLISYEFTLSFPSGINPFYISRKADRVKNNSNPQGIGIVSVEYVGEKEVQCILVDNPEHLYITDDYIVTHNTVAEKLDPWMGPIKDSIEFLSRGKRNMYEEMVAMGMIEVEPLTYIRGRSIPNTLFLLDEAQNLSRAEIKTIVSRMGENSKLILIGDISQIDNPYLDPVSNGLSNVVEKFKTQPMAAHVYLKQGQRSELASAASQIL